MIYLFHFKNRSAKFRFHATRNYRLRISSRPTIETTFKPFIPSTAQPPITIAFILSCPSTVSLSSPFIKLNTIYHTVSHHPIRASDLPPSHLPQSTETFHCLPLRHHHWTHHLLWNRQCCIRLNWFKMDGVSLHALMHRISYEFTSVSYPSASRMFILLSSSI